MTIHTERHAPSPPPPPLLQNHHFILTKLSIYFILTNLIRVIGIQNAQAYFSLFLLFIFLTPATAQQQQQFPKVKGDKTMAIILLILIVLFIALGILSIFTRQCTDRRLRGRVDLTILSAGAGGVGHSSSSSRHRGLDAAVVDSFPTFPCSAVKGLKIGRAVLECAVCLSEFRDDETLRLIPDCCHVFHPGCIDVWLSTHSTCPVCRANLSSSSLEINILNQPDPEQNNNDHNIVSRANDDERNRGIITESERRSKRSTNLLDDENRPVRVLPRCNSTGHSPVRGKEGSDRFTLRLPEEVRDRLVNAGSLSRTASFGVTFQRERSGRWGYRTRSVGRSERFGGSVGRVDRWGFMWTPPFVGRTGSNRTKKPANKAAASVAVDEVDVGEHSCDLLFPKN